MVVGVRVHCYINVGCDMSDVGKALLIILGVIICGVALYFIVSWLVDYLLWGLVGLFVIGSALGVVKG